MQTPGFNFGDVCAPVADAPGRTNLRSATRGDLLIPRTRTKLGERSFRISAPTVWNSLPHELKHSATSREHFRKELKTYLFRKAYALTSENYWRVNLLTYCVHFACTLGACSVWCSSLSKKSKWTQRERNVDAGWTRRESIVDTELTPTSLCVNATGKQSELRTCAQQTFAAWQWTQTERRPDTDLHDSLHLSLEVRNLHFACEAPVGSNPTIRGSAIDQEAQSLSEGWP